MWQQCSLNLFSHKTKKVIKQDILEIYWKHQRGTCSKMGEALLQVSNTSDSFLSFQVGESLWSAKLIDFKIFNLVIRSSLRHSCEQTVAI